MTTTRSATREQLVELRRDRAARATPRRAAALNVAVDRLRPRRRRGRARRLARATQRGTSPAASARAASTAFCWLPPDRPANAHVGARCADVERLHQRCARRAVQRGAVDEAETAAKRASRFSVEVLGERHRRHAADAMPVFGDDADACRGQGLGRRRVIGSPPTAKPPFAGLASSRTARRRGRSGRCLRRQRCRRSRRGALRSRWRRVGARRRRRAGRAPSTLQHHSCCARRGVLATGRVASPVCCAATAAAASSVPSGRARSSPARRRSISCGRRLRARHDAARAAQHRHPVRDCALISASLCVTRTMPQPLAATRSHTRAGRRSPPGSRTAVGSSRTSRRGVAHRGT